MVGCMTEPFEMAAGVSVGEGRYHLEALLGKGGFGQVWRAWDERLGAHVAIKTLLSDLSKDQRARARFEREILTAARLYHPHIVPILDSGRLQDGRPFFAMEYLDGHRLPSYYHDLHTLLLLYEQLLDALAYAHARGVVHRDLKPDNVIITQEPGSPPVLRLLDFGVAMLDEGAGADQMRKMSLTRPGAPIGTVSYMSPEQASGEPSSVGPASDLYSVGVMLYEALTGKLPFEGDWMFVLVQHVQTPPPAPQWRQRFELPDAEVFEDLLGALLHKSFQQRPECAAHVAARLEALRASIVPQEEELFADLSALELSLQSDLEPTLDAPPLSSSSSRPLRHISVSTEVGTQSEEHVSLLRLVEAPLVGRHMEQEHMLKLLNEVARQRRTRVLLLDGPAERGKSRLLRWLMEDAHRRGVARVLEVHIGDGGLPAAMRAALYRWLRLPRLERAPLLKRIKEVLDFSDVDCEALCDFLLTRAVTPDEASQKRWMRLWQKSIWQIAAHPRPRPLLIAIDGVDGAQSAEVSEWLTLLLSVARLGRRALLVVWALDIESGHVEDLTTLIEREDITALALPTLSKEAQAELARYYVPDLSAEVVELLTRRSMGSALFIREQLLEWIESDALVTSAHGVSLASSWVNAAPVQLEAVVLSRIEKFIARHEDVEGARRGLLLLAHLGQSVPEALAQRLCLNFELDLTEMLAEGFIERRPGARESEIAFSVGLMRDLLHQMARKRGQRVTLLAEAIDWRIRYGLEAMVQSDWEMAERCLAVAWVLCDEMPTHNTLNTRRLKLLDSMAGVAWRRREVSTLTERCRMLAQLGASITEPVLQGAFSALMSLWAGLLALLKEEYAGAHRRFKAGLMMLTESESSPFDALKARLLRAKAHAHMAVGETDVGHRVLGEAIVEFRRRREQSIEVNPLLALEEADAIGDIATIMADRGELTEACERLETLLRIYRYHGDRQGEALALMRRCRIWRRLETPERAADDLQQANALMREIDDRRGLALARWEQGSVMMAQDHLEDADLHFQTAARLFATIGEQTSVAMCENIRGEVARKQGRLVAAIQHYQSFRQVMAEHQHVHGLGLADINIGWVYLSAQRPAQALSSFQSARQTLAQGGPQDELFNACIGAAVSAARLDDSATVLEALNVLVGRVERSISNAEALEALAELDMWVQQKGWLEVGAQLSVIPR